MRTALFVTTIMLLISSMADTVFAKDIAVCGESSGYGFYPKFGLAASNEDAGKWVEDAISSGKFTLIQTSEKEFDHLSTTRQVGFTRQSRTEGFYFSRVQRKKLSVF